MAVMPRSSYLCYTIPINKKPNITLIIALAIPVVMMVLLAGAIYLPGIWNKPAYNFVYTDGADSYAYAYGISYRVENGRVVEQNVPYPPESKDELGVPIRYPYPSPKAPTPKLYLYDIVSDSAKEISYEDAQKLNLSANQVSPDGFELSMGNQGGGVFPIFFNGGYDYGTYYLKGHGAAKKLNLPINTNQNYYGRTVRLLGWIIK